MIINSERYELGGHEVILRSATEHDAEAMVDYLATVSGECDYMLCYPDEIHCTLEGEHAFIEAANTSARGVLIMAFVDGEYAGNADVREVGPSRRQAHRADVGIGIYQRFCNMGLGRLMLQRLIVHAREAGFEQLGLTVVSTNHRARHLYGRLGFVECGRIPHANRYDDGSYSDDILMVLSLAGRSSAGDDTPALG